MTEIILSPPPPAVNPPEATALPPDPTGRECSPHYSDEFLTDLINILEARAWPDRLWMYREMFCTRRLKCWLYLYLTIGGEL